MKLTRKRAVWEYSFIGNKRFPPDRGKIMAKKTRRPQAQKGRNEDWMRARLDHANRENTRPAGNVYKRKPKHAAHAYEN